jgi:hypothetical protein
MLGRQVPGGYTQYGQDERMSHRITWEAEHGPLPVFDPHRSRVDVELDHRCNTPSCCNPEHVRPVTSRENNLRSSGMSARNLSRVACPHGHPYDEANTIVVVDGRGRRRRKCRACFQTLLDSRKLARAERRSARLRA